MAESVFPYTVPLGGTVGQTLSKLSDASFDYGWTTGGSGTPGPTGPEGPQGPQGITGDTGATGSTGSAGAQGIPGPDGPQGLEGPPGTPGSTGPAGDDGAAGATGSQGPQGIQGPPGDVGATGADGQTGSQGIQGTSGTPGVAGADGAQGNQGPEGPDGPTTWAGITDKPSTFAPTAHSHAAADVTGTAVVTADARLSDARTPTAHTHAASDITGTAVVTNDARLSDTRTPTDASVTLAKMANMATASLIYRKTAGTGAPEVNTLAQLKTDLALVKADVSLSNVDNTTDAGKPVSTAQQAALDLKAPIANPAFTGTTLTLANAQDVVINATTGSKIGQSGSKIGFFGVAPVVRPTAITQTYATASATHANVTQLAAPAGGTGATAGAYSSAANRDLMIASVNAARTDIANVKQVLNQVIDQLQALGLLQ